MESGGKLFWAEPLKEAEFLRAAAGRWITNAYAEYCTFPEKTIFYTGGLVMALEEEGCTNGEVLIEEEGVMVLGGGLVSAMEEDDSLG